MEDESNFEIDSDKNEESEDSNMIKNQNTELYDYKDFVNTDLLLQIYHSPIFLSRLQNPLSCTFSHWITAAIVVDFNINLGHHADIEYPPGILTEAEKTRVVRMSFPDSNSLISGSQQTILNQKQINKNRLYHHSPNSSQLLLQSLYYTPSEYHAYEQDLNVSTCLQSSVKGISLKETHDNETKSSSCVYPNNVSRKYNNTVSDLSMEMQENDLNFNFSIKNKCYTENWLGFRLRRDSSLPLNHSGISDQTFLLGAALFRSSTDKNSRRGIKQESFVILSPLSSSYFFSVLLPLTIYLGHLYFTYGSSVIYDVCASIAFWPHPNQWVPGSILRAAITAGPELLEIPYRYTNQNHIQQNKTYNPIELLQTERQNSSIISTRRSRYFRSKIKSIFQSDQPSNRLIKPINRRCASIPLMDLHQEIDKSCDGNSSTYSHLQQYMTDQLSNTDYWTPSAIIALWPLVCTSSLKHIKYKQYDPESAIKQHKLTHQSFEYSQLKQRDYHHSLNLQDKSLEASSIQDTLLTNQMNLPHILSVKNTSCCILNNTIEDNDVKSNSSNSSLNADDYAEERRQSVLSSLSSLFGSDPSLIFPTQSEIGSLADTHELDAPYHKNNCIVNHSNSVDSLHTTFRSKKWISKSFKKRSYSVNTQPESMYQDPRSLSLSHELFNKVPHPNYHQTILSNLKSFLKKNNSSKKTLLDSLENNSHYSETTNKTVSSSRLCSRLGHLRIVLYNELQRISGLLYKLEPWNILREYKTIHRIPRSLTFPKSITLLYALGPLTNCVWNLWELVITESPLLVLTNNATRSSSAVFNLLRLIKPLQFSGDYRPYLNAYDPDLSYYRGEVLRRSNRSESAIGGVIMGGSDPVLLQSMSVCPNIMVIEGSKDLCGLSNSSLGMFLSRPSFPLNGSQFSLTNSVTPFSNIVYRTETTTRNKTKTATVSWLRVSKDYNCTSIPKDLELLRLIQENLNLKYSESSTNCIQTNIFDNLKKTHHSSASIETAIFDYFESLTRKFLRAFDQFVQPDLKLLMINPITDTPCPVPFTPAIFLGALSETSIIEPPFNLLPRSRLIDLYNRFISTQTFRAWFSSEIIQKKHKTRLTQFAYCVAINPIVLFPKLSLSQAADGCATLKHLIRECSEFAPATDVLRVQHVLQELKRYISLSFASNSSTACTPDFINQPKKPTCLSDLSKKKNFPYTAKKGKIKSHFDASGTYCSDKRHHCHDTETISDKSFDRRLKTYRSSDYYEDAEFLSAEEDL